ncbi:hypothetical protein SAMD00019534_069450, partial [Acytostelium subglobosum LB1]|uniref:hypothetical protein n=1 Tax=Acytostelium subglobosum LB1 TaxID=1410327 RepID=UPI000644A285
MTTTIIGPLDTTDSEFLEILQNYQGPKKLELIGNIVKGRKTSVYQAFVISELTHAIQTWNKTIPLANRGMVIISEFRLHTQDGIRGTDLGYAPHEIIQPLLPLPVFPTIPLPFIVEVVQFTRKGDKAKQKFIDAWIPNGCKYGLVFDSESRTYIKYTNNIWETHIEWQGELNIPTCPGLSFNLQQMRQEYLQMF